MLADIARTDSSQQGIGDSMQQNIGIGMSFQPVRMRNLDATQNQFSSRGEPMHIIADSTSNHEENDECRMPNDEGNPNDQCRSPLRTADATARKNSVTLFSGGSCFVINSSFVIHHSSFIIVSINNAIARHDAVF